MFAVNVEGIGKLTSEENISFYALIKAHDKKLAKNTIAVEIQGAQGVCSHVDLETSIASLNSGDTISLILKDEERSLDILNHSASHIMAAAIKELYPDVKFAIGPSISHGFYYDFDMDYALNPEDLAEIEKQMKKIISSNERFEKKVLSKKDALQLFKDNPYKVELIEEIQSQDLSIYQTGSFTDLCSGPHIPYTSKVGAFKLLSIAGAYWRGSEKNKMLQRVYGTAFFEKEDLKAYLERIEKAKKSDHRKIGKDLDLFSFHDEAPGFPFFHPKGMLLRNAIIDYWRQEHTKAGYEEIQTPVILSNHLWKTSGHWDHYKENMYFVKIDENDFAVKPMNCPGAILIYKSNHHSYKEFPLKYAEIGLVHRHEKSGVLHGLFRVRNFTQDDAHIFCTEDQLGQEIAKIIDLIDKMYKVFGFENYHIELSTRPQDRIGSEEIWDRAESELRDAIESKGIAYKVNAGDGAFYGPKIDFHIKDCLDRTWQCATIQLDFAMPEKFDIHYWGEDNNKHRPVMLHRVVLGSIERFIGILIENYSGNLPPWLSPVQAVVMPISDKFRQYGHGVAKTLKEGGYRVEFDDRVESLSKKIRQSELRKIPYMVIVGQKEAQDGTITVRKKNGGDIKDIKLSDFERILKDVIEKRSSDY
jgi:threonyl-tRNA synthetase